ncbi:MAG TPA: glycosyl hydrolase family 28-related protein [Bryobacteraceae bacterium]|nr:glycosyl hydrolase family 28-related protein [Bryobacteraceae bacterium]
MKKQPVALSLVLMAAPLWAASYYSVRLDDPKAVYVSAGDSNDIQKAIDHVQETTGQGIVFLAEGRYAVTKTIDVWPGIRLIGYGAKRPVLVLAPSTPGYDDKGHENYLVFFAGSRGGGRGGRGGDAASGRPPDASPGTFYSAMSNVDIEIGEGNPGAVGVRGTYAQHSFLAHIDFHTGSGIAGVHDTGNVMEDVRFFGGQYGIMTRMPSPSWQFTAVDANFEGQREAGIRETSAVGLTLVRPHFRNVPTAVSIDKDQSENLWIRDARLEEVSGPAFLIARTGNPRNEINMESVMCRGVPLFAEFREDGHKLTGPAEIYEVKTFSNGLHYADIGAAGEMKEIFEASPVKTMPEPVKSDLPPLPPADRWVNIHSLGAVGDAKTDDTAAFRKAIAENRVIYVPSGYYVISDTLQFKPDTVLIGLHPSMTQIDLLDRTPAFQGIGNPKPMIEAPKGGANIMIGIGVYTNGINPRAVAVKWMAGKDSLMNDVRFLGGHGTSELGGGRANIYNNTHTADPDLNRRWNGQYPSLWVTDGGGGTFLDIWTPSTFAQAGMLISNTSTEGRIYQMSSEHHVRNEIQIRNASNWRIYALQTEEERGEGGFALPLEITGSSDITIANMHLYRVISSFQPFPYAITVSDSKNIRFRNIHCYSNSKVGFDTTVFDQTHNVELRQRDFAWATLSGNAPAAHATHASPVLAAGAKVQKLAGGFYNISGGAVDSAGDFYFVDAHWQRIYRWSDSTRQLSTVRDNPLDPVNMAFDKAGNLIVVSYAGNGIVYTFKPGAPDDSIRILDAVPAAPRPGMTVVLPVGDFGLAADPATGGPVVRTHHYLSPDGSTFLSARNDFASGGTSYGIKSADVLRSFGLAQVKAGEPFYYTAEWQMTTWRGVVAPDGNLTDWKPFIQQGGEGIAVDAAGNVYLAAGQIYVYNASGKQIDTLEVPERPLQVVFGDEDGQTLFIACRTSLYSIRTKIKGR